MRPKRNITLVSLVVCLACLAKPLTAGYPNPSEQILAQTRQGELTIKPVIGGSSGDNEYCVYVPSGDYLKKVTVHWWSAIDGIQLETSSGQTLTFGSTRGLGEHPEQTHHDSIEVGKDKYIKQVFVAVGKFHDYRVITGISFVIHDNQDGKDSRRGFGPDLPNQAMDADAGHEIIGFWGWHGSVVDCIGIITRARK